VTSARIRLLLVLAAFAAAAPGALAQVPPGRDTLHVVFVGDLNFARSLAREWIFGGRGDSVLAGVRERLRAADIAVGNLESILLERGQTTDPTGALRFAGPVEAIDLLKDAGFDVVGTANNHAWDFGREGLLESLLHLDMAGLAHAGTGENPEAAWRPALVRAKGWTVAIYSLTAIFNDPSMSVVGLPAGCCVAWADTEVAAREFRLARDSLGADLVLVALHAGLEYREVPPAAVVALARGLIHAGADAVIGAHPHVPQGIELVDGRPVAYSLGNFVFHQNSPWTNRGLWAELTVPPGGEPVLRVVPLVVGYAPRFATGADSAAVMAHVDAISARIAQPRLPNHAPGRNVARPRNP